MTILSFYKPLGKSEKKNRLKLELGKNVTLNTQHQEKLFFFSRS